jgi:uncharacterized protein YndB with AHSA1/START domain
MKRFIATLAGAAALSLSVAQAAEPAKFPDWRQYRDVTNSSFVEADGDRVLQLSIVVNATPAQVWDAFTTAEGYRAWVAPVSAVDLRIGGDIEASYDPAAKIGGPDNIRNRIVAYVPQRLLSFRNVQAPKALPHRELFGEIVTTLEIQDLGAGRARVSLTAVGYGPGEGFDVLYRHFEWGNAYSLNELKKRFETGPIDWAALFERQKAAAASATLTGGTTR